MSAPTRPALRYHGGKWKLAPWIVSNFPPHRVYVEPYGGAASVLLRKGRSYAEVYNDLSGDVVNLFRVLRDEGQAQRLRTALELTPFAREEFYEAYEEIQEPVERARRLILRSFMGFGSNGHERRTGFRSNSNRSGTTPAHDWVNYPSVIPTFTERLRGVVIENRPALEILPTHDGPETLFYVDPPYVAQTRDGGSDYAHEMTDEDHRTMAAALHEIRGKVVLSGYPSDLYNSLFSDWERVERAAHADGARERTEVLWLNPAAARQGLFGGIA